MLYCKSLLKAPFPQELHQMPGLLMIFLSKCAMVGCTFVIPTLYCSSALPETLSMRPASDARIPNDSSCVNGEWLDVTLSSLCP